MRGKTLTGRAAHDDIDSAGSEVCSLHEGFWRYGQNVALKEQGGAAGAFYEVMAVCRGSIVVVLKCGNDLYTQIAGGKTEPPRTAEEVDRFGGRMFGRVLLHAMGMCGLL